MASASASYDLVVIGGGINGAGIARDAAGRGLRVLLCERDDLAAHTSSASTKLIHGGLRYLASYELRLVRKALRERELLLQAAPHIIWPLRFVMPHTRELGSRWMVRLGLALYDRLGGPTRLARSGAVRLREHAAGAPLHADFADGYVYSDCWVQDSRLVVINAQDAGERGARIATRTACTGASCRDGRWQVTLHHAATGEEETVGARALVNAAGPWVDSVQEGITGDTAQRAGHRLRLVKGSHVIVPRLFEHDCAYLLQNPDGRVVFAIPYEGDYTLIGTTDEPFTGDPATVGISAAETEYLCATVTRYFRQPVRPDDVLWSYAGVRPLYDDAATDASAVTRDYVLQRDDASGAPLVSVFGGKITTYRQLAEDAMGLLAEPLGCTAPAWTADAALPGGDIPDADFERWFAGLHRAYPFLPAGLLWRYARNYGTRIATLVGDARSVADLGTDFGGGIHEAELDYLVRHEWARTADDVLWRRSRMGLHVPGATRAAIERWFAGDGAASDLP